MPVPLGKDCAHLDPGSPLRSVRGDKGGGAPSGPGRGRGAPGPQPVPRPPNCHPDLIRGEMPVPLGKDRARLDPGSPLRSVRGDKGGAPSGRRRQGEGCPAFTCHPGPQTVAPDPQLVTPDLIRGPETPAPPGRDPARLDPHRTPVASPNLLLHFCNSRGRKRSHNGEYEKFPDGDHGPRPHGRAGCGAGIGG